MTSPRALIPHADAEAFVLALGQALHQAGAPAHRLEDAMAALAPVLGLEGRFFTTPTAIFVSFGAPSEERTALLRIEPAGVNLERMTRLDQLIDDLQDGKLDVPGARTRLDAITAAPERYPAAVTALAYGAASATFARFLGGGGAEIAAALTIGLAVGALARLAERRPALGRVFEWLASMIAAGIAVGWCALVRPTAPQVATLAGLIVLVPGLSLTVAFTELATRNLVAGTARLAGAAMTFLAIGFGLALLTRLEPLAGARALSATAAPLPAWTEYVALLLSPFALTVSFRARPKDGLIILVTGVLAYGTARLASPRVGADLGMLLAAFATGLCGNLYARLARRPAAVPIVPALLLLVPGTLGVRSVASLMDRHVVPGVEFLFTLVTVAAALAAGLLFANLAVPPRKAL